MSIQSQIDELDKSISDIETEASGIAAYLPDETFSEYKDAWEKMFSSTEEKITDINSDIDSINQQIRVIVMGTANHRH